MGVVLRANSVRGEPRVQRNASGEVATHVKYSFYITAKVRAAHQGKQLFELTWLVQSITGTELRSAKT